MRIRYTGQATVRIVGDHTWSPANGYTDEVADPTMVLELLSHPPGDFAVADDEPLLAVVGADGIQELVLAAGIATMDAYEAAHAAEEGKRPPQNARRRRAASEEVEARIEPAEHEEV